MKDRAKLRAFTSHFQKLIYCFVSIITCVIFMAANLILMPLGYLKTCYDKISLVKSNIIPPSDVFVYILLGLFTGILV